MRNEKTVFVGANNGGLEIYIGVGNLVAGNIQTAKTLQYVFETYNIDIDRDTIYFDSTMDFADEFGFDNYDDAKILFEEGVKRIEMTA
jgi:hypothetical protein